MNTAENRTSKSRATSRTKSTSGGTLAPQQETDFYAVSALIESAGGLGWLHRWLLVCLAIECKPRVAVPLETVSRWLGSSPKLAERTINDLEDLGLLTVWRAVEGTQRRPRPVAYRLNKKRLGEIRRRR